MSPRTSTPLSPRAWLALICCTLALGLITGWGLRAVNTTDRWVRSSAARMDAETGYFKTRTDQMIRENEKKIKGAKP